jgi:6-phosphogluconolactonase (cycloisomerase 2 family)
VEGDALHLNQVVSSGGAFPVSVAVSRSRDLVYVLNAGSTGSVTGYRLDDRQLDAISGSSRSLGLSNTNPPFFLSSPAQAGFTRDGRHLVVATKTNNQVDVFAVEPDGRLTTAPTVNAVPGVPFAFSFDRTDRLVLVSAGTGSVSTFTVNTDGSLTPVCGPVSNGQAAACWIKPARGFDYVANTGSGTISQFRVDGSGTVALVNPVAVAGIPGAIDMAAAEDGRFLYVESGGSGSLDAFGVNANGSLALIQSGAVPGGASLEGIIAT